MTSLAAALLATLLAATVEVPPGADLAEAVARAGPGGLVRLAPGLHRGSLGRVQGPLRVEGGGAEVTAVVAGEGEDGLVVEGGTVELAGFALQAGEPRSALKVLGGEARLEGTSLVGGSVAAFVDGGRLTAREVDLSGGYGLLLRAGEASLDGARVRGSRAGLAQLSGRLEVRRAAVTGPATEAAVTLSGGTSWLQELVIRDPGPSGLSVIGRAQVEAVELDIAGPRELQAAAGGAGGSEQVGFLGDCIQLRRGALRLLGGVLARCGGAAVEASAATVDLRGVDAVGGAAGCLVFLDRSEARLAGNRCSGRGPALVSAGGAQVSTAMNRWLADPVMWVDCGSGARVRVGAGETVKEPCRGRTDPLDKSDPP
jgi:hypothetical protein